MQLVSKAGFVVKRLNVCNPKPSYYKLTSLTKTKVDSCMFYVSSRCENSLAVSKIFHEGEHN